MEYLGPFIPNPLFISKLDAPIQILAAGRVYQIPRYDMFTFVNLVVYIYIRIFFLGHNISNPRQVHAYIRNPRYIHIQYIINPRHVHIYS